MLHSGFHGTANRVRALFWFPAQKSCHCAPEQPFYGWVTVLLHTNNLHLNVAAIHNIESNVQLTTAVDIWQTKRKKKERNPEVKGVLCHWSTPAWPWLCLALAVRPHRRVAVPRHCPCVGWDPQSPSARAAVGTLSPCFISACQHPLGDGCGDGLAVVVWTTSLPTMQAAWCQAALKRF